MKEDEQKKHEPHEPKAHKAPNGEIRQVHGRVFNYSLNPRGEVDGLVLEDGTFIKFAPHLGRELTQVTKPNDEVTVIGSLEAPRLIKGYVVVNPATGNALREIKPTPLERSALTGPLQPFRLGGKIKYIKQNSHGDIDGVILEDGATLVFPPHAGYSLAEHLEPEQPLHAVGFGTSNQYGTSVAVAMLGSSPESLAPIGPAPHKARKPKAAKKPEDEPPDEHEKEDW